MIRRRWKPPGHRLPPPSTGGQWWLAAASRVRHQQANGKWDERDQMIEAERQAAQAAIVEHVAEQMSRPVTERHGVHQYELADLLAGADDLPDELRLALLEVELPTRS